MRVKDFYGNSPVRVILISEKKGKNSLSFKVWRENSVREASSMCSMFVNNYTK